MSEPSADVVEAARQKVQMVPAVQEAYLELRRCCAEFGNAPSARAGDRLDAANDRYVSEILAARAALNAAGAARAPGMRHTDACLMNAAKQPPGEPRCIPDCEALRRASRVL